MLKTDTAALDEAATEKNTRLLALLQELGGQRVADDDLLFEGTKFILPETMSPHQAISFLQRHIEAQSERTNFVRTFKYRPYDGAHALQAALKKTFGTAGMGKATMSMFGPVPPPVVTIDVGVNEQAQVPWGSVELPVLEATLYLGAQRSPEHGLLFVLSVECPKRFSGHVEGLFRAVEWELRDFSIYKGKAIDGAEQAHFIDPSVVDRRKVVYTEEVFRQLEANVWSLLRHTQKMRELKVPLKRSVLIEGPYGTGKSLSAMLTAQVAVENGWTFLFCRPGKDDLNTTMQTAQLYQPSIVFVEDVDTLASTGDQDQVSKLLDLFDGITAKGTEMVVVMTTNHPEKIHKGMLRPGRMDAVIHIDALDGPGIEQLIRATVPDRLLSPDLDFEAIGLAMSDFLPAFIKESIDRAMRYGIARTGGQPDAFTTQDFVDAALGLRPQLELMNEAGLGSQPDSLSTAIQREVAVAVRGVSLIDDDGDPVGGGWKLGEKVDS